MIRGLRGLSALALLHISVLKIYIEVPENKPERVVYRRFMHSGDRGLV